VGQDVLEHALTLRRQGEMSTSPEDEHSKFNLLANLELLRERASDVETMADSAHHLLSFIPYIPRSSISRVGSRTAQERAQDRQDDDVRHAFRRLITLVIATDAAAKKMLEDLEHLITRAYEEQRKGKRGGGSGSSDPGSSPPLTPAE
jgi:hypothetical protein